MPSSADSAANGSTTPAEVVSWPRATTRLPLIAICCSMAERDPAGSGRRIVVQLRPSVVTHAAGSPLCDPTDTKPCASAATAIIVLEPVTSFTSCPRAHGGRFGDHPPSARPPAPALTIVPTTMYPAGPAAVATTVGSARSSVIDPGPLAACQLAPFAEVNTTGPGAPTASQPASPCVAPVRACGAGSAETWLRAETRAQEPPEALRQMAG